MSTEFNRVETVFHVPHGKGLGGKGAGCDGQSTPCSGLASYRIPHLDPDCGEEDELADVEIARCNVCQPYREAGE